MSSFWVPDFVHPRDGRCVAHGALLPEKESKDDTSRSSPDFSKVTELTKLTAQKLPHKIGELDDPDRARYVLVYC